MFPWWYFVPVVAIAFVAVVTMRNTHKFRREFGEETTEDEIRQKYPRAWIIPLGRKTGSDKD